MDTFWIEIPTLVGTNVISLLDIVPCEPTDTSHTMNTTQIKLKLSMQQAMEVYAVVGCRGSHVVQTISSQMVVSLSTLRADSVLPP
jgi:hypothetical protein